MPFKPKLVTPDEPPIGASEHVELPADLSTLGEQLSADAAHLAELYPPPPGKSGITIQGVSRRPLIVAIAGAAAVILCIIGSWNLIRSGSPESRSPQTDRMATARTSSNEPTQPTRFSIDGSTSNSAVSLVDLTGPELEAFFDLTGSQAATTASIAF